MLVGFLVYKKLLITKNNTMKTLKITLALALLIGAFTLTSCSSDDKPSTVVVEKSAPAKEDKPSISFGIETDKDGKVSGSVSGEIE